MNQKYLGALVVVSYVIIRMLGDFYLWSKINPYFSYGFEILFVAGMMILYRKNRPWFQLPQKTDAILTGWMMLAGMGAYKMTGVLGMGVPYNLSAIETVIFLLVVAPILEELIFRLALWESLKAMRDEALFAIVASTLLFSLGHLVAYLVVPSSIAPFVIYQSLYVIPLSIVIGYRRHYSKSVTSAILLHFGFNLGFYLASFT
ncbi:MAG: CPBP family intramembrane glutamic endopeptidase [Bacteriovoracia bacterium]